MTLSYPSSPNAVYRWIWISGGSSHSSPHSWRCRQTAHVRRFSTPVSGFRWHAPRAGEGLRRAAGVRSRRRRRLAVSAAAEESSALGFFHSPPLSHCRESVSATPSVSNGQLGVQTPMVPACRPHAPHPRERPDLRNEESSRDLPPPIMFILQYMLPDKY